MTFLNMSVDPNTDWWR